MNAEQMKAARIALGLNQLDFAKLLGWTSKVQVNKIENNRAICTTQTSLAVECLLRRENLWKEQE